jgi:methionine-R-sulfoxide reductase
MRTKGKLLLFVGGAALATAAFALTSAPQGPDPRSPKRPDKVVRTDAEWRKLLTAEQYQILRRAGTEAAFCGGPLLDNKEKGTYHCVGCDLALFTSNAKFESGTGWPSFFQPASRDALWERPDFSYGMRRMEVLCARCDGHLGHVFNDGPRPTGLRFCINAKILVFKKAEE